ncbi:nitroreductase family protein [Halodesulfovibrio sp.]|jgi:nitroreductase|uniref:nitroreductase family protein n=1 Tax=Halodesulfovibrio sp. TaxID=1912772 RepID=UPI0025F1FEE1|nr:nitroreductase family protein [Halodesulfovibrio sp.]MCT4626649.1 nitroreductase family protein [Halodesulfovibrio sp.]
MNVLEAIATRRSIRKYTAEPVSEEHINTMLKAAMAAPSAGNQQPWQFVVIDDKEQLEKASKLSPYVGMIAKAPLAIMVLGDPSVEKYPGNWMLDCSAAIQNILLAAHSEGLGAVWCGLWPEEDRVAAARDMVNAPEHTVPLAVIAVGHPDQKLGTQDRYDTSRVHTNSW